MVKRDLAPTFLAFSISVILGAYNFIFLILNILVLVVQILLILSYYKKLYKLLYISRIILVALTFGIYIVIFATKWRIERMVEELAGHLGPGPALPNANH